MFGSSASALSPFTWARYSSHSPLSVARRSACSTVIPQDAEPHLGFISVLSPVGASLLGLRVGSVARWQAPHGEECAAVVAAILFQPEASGDYTL